MGAGRRHNIPGSPGSQHGKQCGSHVCLLRRGVSNIPRCASWMLPVQCVSAPRRNADSETCRFIFSGWPATLPLPGEECSSNPHGPRADSILYLTPGLWSKQTGQAQGRSPLPAGLRKSSEPAERQVRLFRTRCSLARVCLGMAWNFIKL